MGKAWKIGDDVNTDEIISSEYYPREDIEKLGDYALIDAYPKFAKNKKKGDILLAGENFGCGSSREYGPLALKYTGVKCIIAKSFARIFYRNSINIGLPIMICRQAVDDADEGDNIDADLKNGDIINYTKNKKYKTDPMPKFIMKIVNSGGIIEYIKSKKTEDIQNNAENNAENKE